LDTGIYTELNIGTINNSDQSINIMELSNRTQQVAHQSSKKPRLRISAPKMSNNQQSTIDASFPCRVSQAITEKDRPPNASGKKRSQSAFLSPSVPKASSSS
jgi:hypothetical protein